MNQELPHVRTQRLLDEALSPVIVVESNSEEAWKLWDRAVEKMDRLFGEYENAKTDGQR